MTTIDALIQLAEQIAKGLRGVSRNEWIRWMQVAKRYGVEKALYYAQHLAHDATIRPAQKRANRLIATAVQQHKNLIKQISPDGQLRLYGYVAWHLVIKSR